MIYMAKTNGEKGLGWVGFHKKQKIGEEERKKKPQNNDKKKT